MMHVDGRCHCGRITYEAEINPEQVYVCHCTDCQTLSGTAFRSVAACEHADFRMVTGTPRIYVKVAESGNRRAQAFCPDCGTPLYARDADEKDGSLSLRVGAMKQRNSLVPRQQLWSRSAQSWVERLADMPKAEQE